MKNNKTEPIPVMENQLKTKLKTANIPFCRKGRIKVKVCHIIIYANACNRKQKQI